ncbi:uncharacterized protein LOC133785183 [Humulus lupulus]|uniref:uncharacterized protein LOC133785183 n=1 Tax=Humulus lupulus TaxID=3486 RepID=UPI002B401B17|nr:uncharacterized protein LOC133785183 [Humulus lupulus]
MAKRKKPVRKPEISPDVRPEQVVQEDRQEIGSGLGSQPFEELGDGLDAEMNTVSWADRCDDGDRVREGEFQSDSQHVWQKFQSRKLSFSEPNLEYTEPIFRNGQKLAQVDVEEVRIQSANWSSAMFNDEATRDHVLENGVIHFDRKPVIIRPWTANLSAIRLVRSVPLWIHLHDLGLQYWGSKCLSALVSTIGKPLLVDKFTKERSRIQFARVLVEIEITDNPPQCFQFINEHGQVVDQGIEYEWVPTKCKSCYGFGHNMAECRKNLKAVWAEKVAQPTVEKPLVKPGNSEGDAVRGPSKEMEGSKALKDSGMGEGDMYNSEKNKSGQVTEQNKETQWQTPRRVSSQRHGILAGLSNVAVSAHNQGNHFDVLQEQVRDGKSGDVTGSSSNG